MFGKLLHDVEVPYLFKDGVCEYFSKKILFHTVACTQEKIESIQGANEMNIGKLKITAWMKVTFGNHLW